MIKYCYLFLLILLVSSAPITAPVKAGPEHSRVPTEAELLKQMDEVGYGSPRNTVASETAVAPETVPQKAPDTPVAPAPAPERTGPEPSRVPTEAEVFEKMKRLGLIETPVDSDIYHRGVQEPKPRPGIGEQFGNLFSRSFSKINFGEILGKALWAGIIVMIGWVISKRQNDLLYINRIARDIIVKGKSLFEYFSEDGRRLIALSIILSSLLIGWMFRYEHVQGLLFRDRITGQIFKGQITNSD